MKRLGTISCCLLLAACAADTGNRDASAPISSIASFETSRFAGTWYQIASFPLNTGVTCRNTILTYTAQTPNTLNQAVSCQTEIGTIATSGPARVTGPGRLTMRAAGESTLKEIWVLWVDGDYRTAVLGTPDGSVAYILDRTPNIPQDRLKASLDVLNFNGFDTDLMRMTRQEDA